MIGGGVGVTTPGRLRPFAEFGRLTNIMPSSLLDRVEELLEGFDVANLDLNLRATYGLFGVRFLVPAATRLLPYIEGGVGFARMDVDASVSVNGIEFDDEDVPGLDDVETEPVLAVGGGIGTPVAGNTSIEAGYRYFRVNAAETLNVSQVYGAIRLAF
jgi:opacity protein-like surface antigen